MTELTAAHELTASHIEYLASQLLGRPATAGADYKPHVVPTSFRHNGELGTARIRPDNGSWHGFTGNLVRWLCPSHNELVIHLRVVSPPDVTTTLVPMLGAEPAVLNHIVLPGAVRNPDGDAVHFDVLHGAANEVIGCMRDLGLEQRGSIVLENIDTSISALADRARRSAGDSSNSRPSGRRSRPESRWMAPSRPAGTRCWSSPGSSAPSGSSPTPRS